MFSASWNKLSLGFWLQDSLGFSFLLHYYFHWKKEREKKKGDRQNEGGKVSAIDEITKQKSCVVLKHREDKGSKTPFLCDVISLSVWQECGS